ncbi:hypothetical protein ACQPZG_32520 [Streptomyces sp. CA-294286]|uniref:hypothetical protein n=1 Tax=Streptomyces sp. CA-294286 TaxID=3240070 RepID=UPI003D8ECEED
MLNLSNAEARESAMPGVHATGKTGTALIMTPAPVAGFLTDACNTGAPEAPPAAADPAADRDVPADAWSLTPPTPAAALRAFAAATGLESLHGLV